MQRLTHQHSKPFQRSKLLDKLRYIMKDLSNILIGTVLGIVITWLFCQWYISLVGYTSAMESFGLLIYGFFVFTISTGIFAGIISAFRTKR